MTIEISISIIRSFSLLFTKFKSLDEKHHFPFSITCTVKKVQSTRSCFFISWKSIYVYAWIDIDRLVAVVVVVVVVVDSTYSTSSSSSLFVSIDLGFHIEYRYCTFYKPTSYILNGSSLVQWIRIE